MTDAAPQLVPVAWFGKGPDAVRGAPTRPAVALWRLDQDEQVEFMAEANDRIDMICAHVSGSIDWAARIDSRHYQRPCLPNTFCLQAAGEAGDVRYARAHASFIHLYYPRSWLADRAAEFGSGATAGSIELIDPMNARCDEVGRWSTLLARSLRDGLPGGDLEAEAATLMILAALLRKHSNLALRAQTVGGLAGWQLKRSKAALEALDARFDLATLAADVGLSTHHFCRAFKVATGVPPHAYQLRVRLETAQRLLEASDLSLGEIAHRVGYADQGNLSRLFRNTLGMTPGQFRRERRG